MSRSWLALPLAFVLLVGCVSTPRDEGLAPQTLAAYPFDYPFGKNGSADHPDGYDGRPGDADDPDGGDGGDGFAGGNGGRGGDAFGDGDGGDGGKGHTGGHGGRGGDAFGTGDGGDGGSGGHGNPGTPGGHGGDGGDSSLGRGGDGGNGGNVHLDGVGGDGGHGGRGRAGGDGGHGGNTEARGTPGKPGKAGWGDAILGLRNGENGRPGEALRGPAPSLVDLLALQIATEIKLREMQRIVAGYETRGQQNSQDDLNVESDVIPLDIRITGRGSSHWKFRDKPMPRLDDTAMAEFEYAIHPRFQGPVIVEIQTSAPGPRGVVAARWGSMDTPGGAFVTLRDAEPMAGQPRTLILRLVETDENDLRRSGRLPRFMIRRSLGLRIDQIRIVPASEQVNEPAPISVR